MSISTPSTTARPHVVVKPRRALPFFSRHPWIFSGAIERVDGEPEPGAEVDVVSHDGQFIARGLYNPNSNIRVRLYSWDESVDLDEAFWSARLDDAIALRRGLFERIDERTACRWVYSEGDQLSGLIVDQFGKWLVLQFTSLALAQRQQLIVDLLKQKFQPSGIWLRTEKGIREAEGISISDGPLDGPEPPRPVFIEEHGVSYGIDIVRGQKTGFYLDQSLNRLRAASYVKPGPVLDMFCYSGGFGLTALKLGQAESVVGMDVSEAALVLARANAEMNGFANRVRYEKADAFEMLETLRGAGERFRTVFLDPPKMARHRSGLAEAFRGYHHLNRMAIEVLEPGGILITCSCSGHVTLDDFQEVLAKAAVNAKRSMQILETRSQSPDHPMAATCRETSYLKCCICRVL